MTRGGRGETTVYWVLIALTVVLMAMVTRDAWNRIGRPVAPVCPTLRIAAGFPDERP